ncbi:MAG TPA: transcription factor FapR [Halanaerobiales bacterium]|nr:transcription factor FapR [Halanaerobiales bacterium]
MSKLSKEERQKQLNTLLENNPLLTDRELADRFYVSIQTIRLDRMKMGIPEVRERTKTAASAYARLKSVNEGEVIGKLIELELNKYARSVLETTVEMALQRSQIIRGHYLFAQANSLAVAVINASSVLTGTANLKFHKTVHIGDVIIAEATLVNTEGKKNYIKVNSYLKKEKIFSSNFIMFAERE